MPAASDNLITVELALVINGRECFYSSTASRAQWEYPEYRLMLIKSLKAKLLDRALAGLEPKVTVHDGPIWTAGQGPLEDVSADGGHSATVEAR